MPLSWTFSRKVYFVVMRNFLPAAMWLTFDLKGATANRRSLDVDRLLKRSNGATTNCSYGTLRDWEWLDCAMCVDIPAESRLEVATTLHEDAKFLGEQGLLDYS